MPVTPLEPNDPQRLGQFELMGRLGAGGMGVVYLGRSPGGDLVAVKLVRSDLAHEPTFRERFRREVEALRRVSGPRVARLIAADTEAPQPFLVVEYVDGPTLADSVAANGPIAGARLRALAAALAEAVVVIHEVGVIHRDLKPSNIILAADQPKLVDFGIAAAAGSMPLTMAGTVIGSAGWMAPEQASGAVSTPAVDVFTWASLVAFAGTGRPPFGLGGPDTVTARILNGAPDLEGLPQEVRPFVEAAFIKDPAQRPSARALLAGLVDRDEATTDELVEETTHLIENTWVMPAGGWPVAADRTPVQPPPPPAAASSPSAALPPERAPQPRRLWPVIVAVAVVALLCGVAGALLLTGGGSDDGADDASTPPSDAPGVPATTVAPTTTVPPTTTTTAPPIDLTVALTLSQDDFGDFFDQLVGVDPGCADPGALVGLQQVDGTVLAEPTAFGEGERVSGGLVDDCDYVLDLPQVARADQYLVTLSDSEGDFDPATVTQSDLDASGGIVDLNELFEIGQFVPSG